MGGGTIDDWCMPTLAAPRTMVLMGRAGNGKSATGNSILGKDVFESTMCLGGVTSTVEFQTTTLTNGEVLNVIDTPGLFDFRVGSELISQEIVKCIDLAKDGIHAVLVVVSLRARFTEEEAAAIESLQTFFGPKLTNYMVVVFTGGDGLKKGQLLEDFLARSCPEPLKRILEVCKNRSVVFDNNTEDERKKESQLQNLLTLVDKVIEENGRKPYTDSLFAEFKKVANLKQQKEEAFASEGHTKEEVTELTEQLQKSYDEQLKRMTEMVDSKLKDTNEMLQQELAHERAARLKAEKIARDAQKKSEDEIRTLSKNLAKAMMNAENAERESKDKLKQLRDNLAEAEKLVQDAQEHKCAIL